MAFGVTTYENQPVGILSAQVISINQGLGGISAYGTLGIQTFRYDLFNAKATEIDQKTQSRFLDPAITKKGQIVSIGDSTTFIDHPEYHLTEVAALSAASALYGLASEIQTSGVAADVNVGLSVSMAAADAGSYVLGDPVVNADGVTVGTIIVPRTLVLSGTGTIGDPLKYRGNLEFKRLAPVGLGDTLTASGITTNAGNIKYIGIASVYDDFAALTRYPNLEPSNGNVDNPYGGRETVGLSSSNHGIGAGVTFYANSVVDTTYGNFVDTTDTLPFRGDVLAFSTTTGSSEASDIADLRAEFTDIRSGITSYISASNSVKKQKNSAALNVYTLKRAAVITEAERNEINATIDVLEDPTFVDQ